MADLIRDIAPGVFVPSRRPRRRDDEDNDSDFSRWMAGGSASNDRAVPTTPLSQTPMTSLEDMLLLAHAREQIDTASVIDTVAYANVQALDELNEQEQSNFEFVSKNMTGTFVNKQI